MFWPPRTTHSHIFDPGNPEGMKRTIIVCILTVAVMILEVGGGYLFNSLALTADGWHLGSHVLVLALSVAAYMGARRYAGQAAFTFGTWKIEILGGFTSAIFLFFVALTIVAETLERFHSPEPIAYNQALVIAIIGLVYSVASAILLREHHHMHAHSVFSDCECEHGDHADCCTHHPDLNLRAAYIHVLADGIVSILTVIALLGGKYLGWDWLDALVGLVGGIFIGLWSIRLAKDCGAVLLDAEVDLPLARRIAAQFDERGWVIMDMHLWRVGRQKYACIVDAGAEAHLAPADVRHVLRSFSSLVHLTVETHVLTPEEMEEWRAETRELAEKARLV